MKPPYEITRNILALFGDISESLGVCKTLLLVKPEARLSRSNRAKAIHSSLAIEGNTLGIKHVTALMGSQSIVGPEKDILAAQNAIRAYELLGELQPYRIKDFLKAHHVLMNGLVDTAGRFRTTQVGIVNEKGVAHIAPGHDMVPGLMADLFGYLGRDDDPEIIRSCVFHYETEFIHPFEDGNGRMGRYWQTRLLMNVNPIFEYVPVESAIRENQEGYCRALEMSDNTGSSTFFIEFMLKTINESLRDTISSSSAQSADYGKRTDHALSILTGWFGRKEYMNVCKGISTATASRDLKQMMVEDRIESAGSARMTMYRKVSGG
jgi:Fic family protein